MAKDKQALIKGAKERRGVPDELIWRPGDQGLVKESRILAAEKRIPAGSGRGRRGRILPPVSCHACFAERI